MRRMAAVIRWLCVTNCFSLHLATPRGVDWWVNSSPSPYLDLSTVIRALRGALGGWGVRGLLGQALVLLLYQRLGGICGRMERLVARFHAGRLWRVSARKVSVRPVEVDARKRVAPVQVLPRRFAWLVRLAAYQAAGYGSQLRAVLETPEMVALLVAAPQAVRILRPLCRMLAVETSVLRPRLASEADLAGSGEVVVGEKAPVRVRRPREPVDWGRIPLPRGVLSVARRNGFGKFR